VAIGGARVDVRLPPLPAPPGGGAAAVGAAVNGSDGAAPSVSVTSGDAAVAAPKASAAPRAQAWAGEHRCGAAAWAGSAQCWW
jgi:hypothetical protein